jgi:uncharacterized protein (UPF0264 family)
MTRLLVSVRDVPEALAAAAGGADFIDLKEPRDGALGGLALPTIAAVVVALRERGIELPISATIGDLGMDRLPEILERVAAVAACGVDYVKVGIERAPQAPAVLDALAACGPAVVPVFIADHGLDARLLQHACALGFPALMVDTADKLAGSLFDVLAPSELQTFIDTARASGALAGLAGALRLPHLPQLTRLQPDFAGFRTAVCAGPRSSALDRQRVHALAQQLHRSPVPLPL